MSLSDERIEQLRVAASKAWGDAVGGPSMEYILVRLVEAALSTEESKPVPMAEIGSILNEVMDMAIRHGANSVSMPDEYVAVAHFISYPHEYRLDAARPIPMERNYDIDDPDEDYKDEACPRCRGDGMDPWNDYLLPCALCQGEQT